MLISFFSHMVLIFHPQLTLTKLLPSPHLSILIHYHPIPYYCDDNPCNILYPYLSILHPIDHYSQIQTYHHFIVWQSPLLLSLSENDWGRDLILPNNHLFFFALFAFFFFFLPLPLLSLCFFFFLFLPLPYPSPYLPLVQWDPGSTPPPPPHSVSSPQPSPDHPIAIIQIPHSLGSRSDRYSKHSLYGS